MRDLTLFLWLAAEIVVAGTFLWVLIRHGVRSWMPVYGMFILAPLTMAPFAYDEANRTAVALYFETIRNSMDWAITLTVIGLALFAAGIVAAATIWRPRTDSGFLPQLVSTWEHQVWTPVSFWILVGLSLMLTAALAAAGVPFGSGLTEAFAGSGIRPIMNMWQSVLSVSMPFCVCYVLWRRSLLTILAAVLVVGASFYTGQRTVSLINLIIGVCAWLAFRNQGRLSVAGQVGFVVGAVALLLSSALVYQVRAGGEIDLSLAITSFYGDFAYGNQFSDVRDFAWVLSGYDGQQLHGLSYLAGIASLFLSAESPLRAEYAIGRWTLWTAGLDTNAHGGLRMPFFAELYFNFGMLGLAIVTPILGWLTAAIVTTTRRYTLTFGHSPAAELLCALLLFTARDVVFTSAMFRVFVVVALFAALWVVNAVAYRSPNHA